MVEILLFVLVAYGMTQILVYSDMPVIKKLRPHKASYKGYGKVFIALCAWDFTSDGF